MICIDLPFHGKTNWNENLLFTIGELIAIMEGIAQEQKRALSRFSIAGFSLGGRVAIALVPFMARQIDKLLLMAPDGIIVNFWYWLSTQNAAGNRLFKFTMNHPYWLITLIKTANRFGLVNRSIYKFSMAQVEDQQARKDLYRRWTIMRRFNCARTELKHLISDNKIAIEMIYGKHDRVMLVKTGIKFQTGIEDLCNITVLPCGHQVLHPKNAATIVTLLSV